MSAFKPAIRCGSVYCSPSCGFGCKHVAYVRANREALKLCKVLGRGWTPVVWENCGWHFSATKGAAAVHATLDGSSITGKYKVIGYTAFFNSRPQIVLGSVKGEAPNVLVGRLVREARLRARIIAEDASVIAEGLIT